MRTIKGKGVSVTSLDKSLLGDKCEDFASDFGSSYTETVFKWFRPIKKGIVGNFSLGMALQTLYSIKASDKHTQRLGSNL